MVRILAWHDIWQSKKYANGILAFSDIRDPDAPAVGDRDRDPDASNVAGEAFQGKLLG